MSHKMLAGSLAWLASALLASPAQSQAPVSALTEGRTEAFQVVVRLHAAQLATLPHPEKAGIWLVQDAGGHRISSGVAEVFPASISSYDFGYVVPAAAGHTALEFGFARTPVVDNQGPFRVVYVTVADPPARGPGAQ